MSFSIRSTAENQATLHQLDLGGVCQPADGRISRTELTQALRSDPTLLDGLDAASRQTIEAFVASEESYLQIVSDSPQVNTGATSRHEGPAAAVAFPPETHASRPGEGAVQPQLRRRFLDGQGFVYSQNFGLLDREHISFWASAYIQVYLAAQRAQQTGQAQTITLHPGSGITSSDMQYTIDPPGAGGDLFAIARGICADASYRYEESTNYGDINRLAQAVGRGTSAFSTEDLSSNAVGMRAAEEQIRTLITNPAEPHRLSPEAVSHLQGMVPSGTRSFLATDSAEHAVFGWVLRHAGPLHTEADAASHGVERTSFGNHHFPPRTTSALGTPDANETSYFQLLERESHARGGYLSGHGPGWRLQD